MGKSSGRARIDHAGVTADLKRPLGLPSERPQRSLVDRDSMTVNGVTLAVRRWRGHGPRSISGDERRSNPDLPGAVMSRG